MRDILLDTHVWLWLVNGDSLLSDKTQAIIEELIKKGGSIYLAAISLREIAMLEAKQRIVLSAPCVEWLNKGIEYSSSEILSLTPEIAAESCCLPGKFNGDPADRLIVASARVRRLALVTKDKNILQYAKNNYLTAIAA